MRYPELIKPEDLSFCLAVSFFLSPRQFFMPFCDYSQRQMNIVQETYGEVFALELLVQQMFISCNDPEYRALMAIAVRYTYRHTVIIR